MYDQSTLDLVHQAPIFGDLDLENIPKDLTNDYTQIVSARIRLNQADIDGEDLAGLEEILHEAMRLALTYEAYVVALLGRENLASAAFVAASAHQVCIQANRVLGRRSPDEEDYLSPNSIDSEIAAGLLFFISGYTADAAEIAKGISTDNSENSITSKLTRNIKCFLLGDAGGILSDYNAPIFDNLPFSEEGAVAVLWELLNSGVFELASGLLTVEESSDDRFQSALKKFQHVKSLATDQIDVELEGFRTPLVSIFSGPRHLATLLEVVANVVPNIALVRTPAPSGLDVNVWKTKLVEFAQKRPFLWPNHLEAIETRYLEPGVSAVVSFPTGGGKSTLAELKIATYVLQRKSVIFIAPTLALVDQVAKNLRDEFPTIKATLEIQGFVFEGIEIDVLPDLAVMTPESCLARMSFNPDLFEEVELFAFDECHLLHPKGEHAKDRRSIDAMLCLLRIIELSPNVDLLLMSAMVRNNEEIAAWLGELTGRQVLSLNIAWKPTRQAKGCVVYDADRTEVLRHYIQHTAPRTASNRLTAAAKRNLTAIPYSFVSLNQTWHSNSVADYRLLKLSDDEITLAVSDFSHLTSNRNHVAAVIAKKSGQAGIKTLVFSTSKRECDSIVKNAHFSRVGDSIVFTENERQLLSLINEEVGDSNHTYVSSDSSSLPHHGLLFKEERMLHEGLFKRVNGVNILVATSTLAQGMNLPAQIVIIAGNTRFDIESGGLQELYAHELLNAAGRAGRAGESSQGLVLVIPSRVVDFNSQKNMITSYWRLLQEVFSESDQCLDIQDPITIILDRIHQGIEEQDYNVKYFLERISVDENGELDSYIRKTFCAFQARQRKDQEWIDTRIKAANDAFALVRDDSSETTWREQLAAASGISATVIRDLHRDFIQAIAKLHDTETSISWLIEWISGSFARVNSFFREESLTALFGKTYTSLKSEQHQLDYIRIELVNLVSGWLAGDTIRDLELAIGTDENKLKKCDKARRFAIRIIPDIAYGASILSQIYKFHLEEEDEQEYFVLFLTLLGRLVRVGLDVPEKLALYQILKGDTCRVNCHRLYRAIKPFIGDIKDPNVFSSIMSAVEKAYRKWEDTPP